MIIKEEFLNKLRHTFNLNIYEVKIWTALLSRGVSTAGELSSISEVPRSRSYDVLESLEKKNFIVMKLGKPIQYLAVPPDEIMKRMKRKVQTNATKQLELFDKIRTDNVFSELELLYKQGIDFIEPSELSGSFKGRDNVYGHLDGMIKNAKNSISIVTTAEGLVRKNDYLKNVLRKMKEKGVSIRIAAPITKASLKAAKSLSEVADVRHLAKLNARYSIIDSKNVLFMVSDDKEVHEDYDIGIWVSTPFFASALETLFNTGWNSLPKFDKVSVR